MKYYKEYNPGMLLITHYQRLLDYIKPTHVHIIEDGKIIKTGDYKLVKYIEEHGFDAKNKKNIISIGECAIKEKINHE